jgi:hypothetical protein
MVKFNGWGEFVLAELPQLFDQADVSHFLPYDDGGLTPTDGSVWGRLGRSTNTPSRANPT